MSTYVGTAFNEFFDASFDFEHAFMYGKAGNDTLIGSGFNDYIQGDSGNDWLDGGYGNDSEHGVGS